VIDQLRDEVRPVIAELGPELVRDRAMQNDSWANSGRTAEPRQWRGEVLRMDRQPPPETVEAWHAEIRTAATAIGLTHEHDAARVP